MCSDAVAIHVSSLSKQYQLYDQPQDRFKAMFMPRLRNLLGLDSKAYSRIISALQPLSFVLKRGTTLGIIGTNGSGKSTLLQLICGTLTPSTGEVAVKGRVAALLELGTGFNLEFTGRENVYLNASILGLTDQEIKDRIDQIIAFADIGEFIDQPVKTYSSGMYVRLAFAIIAHVDADILVIDEALAVGDSIFTQKCMRFIREFQKRGTLLFVSHDTASIQNLCDECLWLNNGQMMALGDAKTVTEQYLKFSLQAIYGEEAKLSSSAEIDPNEKPAAIDYNAKVKVQAQLDQSRGWETGEGEVLDVELKSATDEKLAVFVGGERVRLSILAKAKKPIQAPILGFLLKDRLGQILLGENTLQQTKLTPINLAAEQLVRAEFDFTLPMLPNGDYAISASFADGSLEENIQHHFLHEALILKVSSSKVRWGLVGVRFDAVRIEVDNG